MKKKLFAALLISTLTALAVTGCSKPSGTDTSATAGISAPESASGTEDTSEPGSTGGSSDAADRSSGAADPGKAQYTIGIGQFAVHGSLDNCRTGFIKGLADEGIVEGKNLTVLYENANADGGTSSQIIDNFLAKKVDLICAIATPMAQSAYSATRNGTIPVIYTAVTDPVKAELASADGKPVGNVTGTSDKLPVTEQLQMIRKILPDAKKIGIMYSTSEVNSLSTIAEYKAAASNYGFEIVESGISSSADIPLAADQLVQKVDCISNLTDNTVVSSLQVVLSAANKKGIPVFGSEVEQVKSGCLAAEGLDYVQLGIQTGRMAAKVLKGEAEARDMNFEILKQASFYGNNKAAQQLGITLPQDLVNSSAGMFDTITVQ